MTKLTVRLQSPDVPEDSFAAKPKTMYRAGNGYCRTEEQPDSEHGIHGLMIINEPDTWMVNLLATTAQHYLDPGPTFNCRMPVFVYGEEIKSGADVKKPLFELEFGREISYFKAKGAIPKPGPVLRDKPTNVYASDWGHTQLKLHLRRLEELEYLIVHRGGRGQSFVYELNWSGFEGEKSGGGRPQAGGMSGGGRVNGMPMNTGANGIFAQNGENGTYTEVR